MLRWLRNFKSANEEWLGLKDVSWFSETWADRPTDLQVHSRIVSIDFARPVFRVATGSTVNSASDNGFDKVPVEVTSLCPIFTTGIFRACSRSYTSG